MLTLLKNIERFNKRYNKKRGSAMLMVLMTMAIIIVVGTSMLFVTLSSFSNSIADTRQERAYNAALAMTDTLKGSSELDSIIETYAEQLQNGETVSLQFYNDDSFDPTQSVNYTTINGVKVYVTLTNVSTTASLKKVLVDVRAVKGSQESKVSFETEKVTTSTSTSIEDTFGSSFVVSNNMGQEKTSPDQIFKRIEGDVSINCFENEGTDTDQKRVMKTRLFNPLVLEGVTGSIYANGDLIIGAVDNMIRVQGNIYVDGNLTIRGLSLGVNLPALMKKYYNRKYINYWTYAKPTVGSIELVFKEPTETKRDGSSAIMGEAMYEWVQVDGVWQYRPIQVYDKIPHYTLMDLAGENAETYTFWTKNWNNGGAAEQVTITLRVKDSNGMWQEVDAEYKAGGIDNSQYLGASMYYDQACTQPIVQFPQGGNIYCSGDIIFDTVNRGNVYTYDAGFANYGITDEGKDDTSWAGDIDLGGGKLQEWVDGLKGDLINTKYDYYSLSYNIYSNGSGKIPVQTNIEGDVFCQGRMIIAPDVNVSYINYKKVEKLDITTDLGRTDNYINYSDFKDEDFVFRQDKNFFKQIKDKWASLISGKWGDEVTIDPVTLDVSVAINRFDSNYTINEKQGRLQSFIEAYKEAYNKLKTQGDTRTRLKNLFENLGKDGYSYITGGGYTDYGGGKKNISDYRTPTFSATSNLYIQNDPIRKGTGETTLEQNESYATEDLLRIVQNVADKDKNGNPDTEKTVVNGVAYTAALTVKYCEITVENVFCNGAISVLESDIPGYTNKAAVNVKGEYFASDYIKSELQKASIYDFLKTLGISDEDILEDYFGVDDDENNFKATTDVYFNMQTEWNNETTYHDEWWGWNGALYGKQKADVTYRRKVIIISAAMEIDETAYWENINPEIVYHEDKLWKVGQHDEHYDIYDNWTLTGYSQYSPGNWRYVADMMYVVDEEIVNNPGRNYDDEVKKHRLKGEVIDRNGNKVDSKYITGNIKKAVDWIKSNVDGNTNTVNLANRVFLNFIDNDNYRTEVYNELVNNRQLKAFGNTPVSGASYTEKQLTCKWAVTYKCKKYNTSATYTHTVRKTIDLTSFADIYGGNALKGYDKLSYVLSGNDILRSTFLNKDFLITMFSNSAISDFDGIYNANMVGSAIKGGKAANFGLGISVDAKFDTMKRGTRAFDGFYGMYLVKNSKYSDTDNNAYVQAIFEEICSSTFATVVEANMNTEEAKDSLEQILKELQDEGNINEYNEIDIYGGIGGKEVKNYYCADGKQLRKKLIGYKQYGVDAQKYESWFKVNTLDEGQAGNMVVGYIYLGGEGSVENDSDLRLFDFYNKNNSRGAHLRADSTFAVDEKYDDAFTINKLSIKDFSAVAKRSEIQYTIKKNTYFNFGDVTESEIVFRASANGATQRTRMNFLIDTSDEDIYIFFRGKDDNTAQFIFNKCTFQVTGKNNVYIMLLGDTSFSANAFSTEINNSLGSNDKSDERVGTHFISGTYQKYGLRFKMHDAKVRVTDIPDAIQVKTYEVGERQNVGSMFIIGMGKNVLTFGRGGSVNALVYIPNGTYTNNSKTLLNVVPIASSGNNEASIVAKDIYIGGNNRGKLIFTSYDVARVGAKNSSSAGLIMDGLINSDTVTHGSKWVAGRYYYG